MKDYCKVYGREMHFHETDKPPQNPELGDVYYDSKIDGGCILVWNESAGKGEWKKVRNDMAWTPPPPPPKKELVTDEELLELYPDLRELADKYKTFEILKRAGQEDDHE